MQHSVYTADSEAYVTSTRTIKGVKGAKSAA